MLGEEELRRGQGWPRTKAETETSKENDQKQQNLQKLKGFS